MGSAAAGRAEGTRSDSDVPATIVEAAAALRTGAVTSVDLVRGVLARADAADPEIGVYLARFDDQALAAAARADEELAGGTDRGPLHGIPLGVKDILATREGPTTAHSLVPNEVAPPGTDAETVVRLRAGGGVVVGKTTLSEFACGAPDPTSGLPVPANPWDTAHWPGGSSSGTASGVAAGFFLGGLGTDTGGSIRIPAACCGITGLKPTYGRVPKSRCIPLGTSLDTVGPMARTAADCAVMLQAIAGPSTGDPTTVDRPVPDFTAALSGDLHGVRVGVERVHHGTGCGADPEVVERVEQAVVELERAGAHVEEVVFDHYDLARAASFVVMHAEAFAQHRARLRDHWSQYGAATRMLLAQGLFVGGADYVQAQRARSLVRDEVRRVLERVDVLVAPTIGAPVPRLDADFVALLPQFFTEVWNLTGNPALSMPVGRASGLPVGMQVVGRPFEEATVLQVGDAYQQRTDWHRQVPALPGAPG